MSVSSSHGLRTYRPWRLGLKLSVAEWLSVVLVVSVLVLAGLGPVIAPSSPTTQSFQDGALKPPGTSGHILGTDQLARDLLSRLLVGTRISFGIALVSVAFGLVVGAAIGVCSGFFGGVSDALAMRSMDVLMAFPVLVLALVIAGALGPNLRNTIIAIAVVMIPGFARVSRNLTMREGEREYVRGARAVGASGIRIMLVHILPNIWVPIAAATVLALAYAVPAEAALSFLGLGVQPPAPSWGNMIGDGYQYLAMSPWVMLLPAAAIVTTVTALSVLGDAIARRTQEGQK